MEPYQKNELGMKRANPSAIGSNFALTARDYVGVDPSMDIITLTTSGNFTAFVFNGVTVTLDTAIAINANNAESIRQALYAEINKYEHTVWISVEYSGGDLTIKHIGHLRLASVAVSDVGGGSQQATTLLAKLVGVCTYTITDVVGTLGPLSYKETTQALGNDPYAHSGTLGTDNATAAQLANDVETAIAALGITIYGQATGTNDADNTNYDVTFDALKLDQALKFTGAGADKIMTESNCRQEFIA